MDKQINVDAYEGESGLNGATVLKLLTFHKRSREGLAGPKKGNNPL